MAHRPLALALIIACCAGASLDAADAPAAPPAAAPAATQPEVNTTFLQKCSTAADLLVTACKTTGVGAKLGNAFGSSKPAGGDDKLKLAEGFKIDVQSLMANKKVASDGAFAQLTTGKKDAIATTFKGVPMAEKLQAAFADDGIGKALLNATPVDKVPGYQKSLETLQSLTK